MVKNVQQIADKYYPGTWYLCGQSANMYDLKNCVEHDNTTVTLITIISIEDEQALSGYQNMMESYGQLQELTAIWNEFNPAFQSINSALDASGEHSVCSGLSSVSKKPAYDGRLHVRFAEPNRY